MAIYRRYGRVASEVLRRTVIVVAAAILPLLAAPAFAQAVQQQTRHDFGWISPFFSNLPPRSTPACADVAAYYAAWLQTPMIWDQYPGSQGNMTCWVSYSSGGLIGYHGLQYSCPNGQWEDINYLQRAAWYGNPANQLNPAIVAGECRLGSGVIADTNNFDAPKECCKTNPINLGTGNKYQRETDYSGTGDFPLRIVRHYNSRGRHDAPLNEVGGGFFEHALAYWQHDYERWIRYYSSSDPAVAVAYVMRPNGRYYAFKLTTGGGWDPVFPYVKDRMIALTDASGALTGWRYFPSEEQVVETYDLSGKLVSMENYRGLRKTFTYNAAGRLATAVDSFGRSLTFTYYAPVASNGQSRIQTITDPAGGIHLYQYFASGALQAVTYPGGSIRNYVYESAGFPHLLTGIVDENGARFATWAYNTSDYNSIRATLSEHAGGANRVSLSYAGGSTEFTDALNVVRQYGFQVSRGAANNTSIAGSTCPDCGPAAQTYDANGYVASRNDWNGNRTNFTNDARGLETQRVEALTAAGATTPQTRTINTQWHATLRLPVAMAEPLRKTTYVYNGDGGANCGTKSDGVTLVPGALCSRTVQATSDADGALGFAAPAVGTPRVWAYTYNHNGLVLTVNGPRTDVADVTTTTYYADNDADLGKRGNVATVTNAAGHATTITAYNAHGQPLSMTDANGLVTAMTYDARMRLTSRNVGGEITSYEYDGVGQLTKVTLPDGSFLAYTYDAAHRLTAMQDNLANRIAYTLDLLGNRTAEQVFDPANALAQTRSRVYSNLNRLFQEIGAAGQTTEYAYDNQGNVASVKDPLNRITANQYDALNRLKQVTDPNLGVTQYGYNGLDALTSVSDPRSLVTGYTVDGLGNLTQQASPDTGTTASTYDAAGNLATQTDAKGQTTAYAYDALNRVTLITFADGSKQTYGYDAGANGFGRLTSITETNPANAVTNQIAYAYDAKGRVTSETRTVAGVSYVMAYTYDASGRMSGMTYPSGRTVDYAFDGLGRVNQISTTKDATTAIVAQNIQYQPFGAAKSWTLGNGQLYSRVVDLDGRIGSYTLGAAVYALAYDAASRITSIGESGNPPNTNTYGYDALDRLTSGILPASNFGYSYDAVGNRTTKTTGAATDLYAYGATSNRLSSITPASGPLRSFAFDANGSTTSDAVNGFGYDARGRLIQATSAAGTTSYQVNALGQRIRKSNTSGDVIFHYDTRGRLIAETDPAGALKREYLYLNDVPVGVVQ